MTNKTIIKNQDAEKLTTLCEELEVCFEQKRQADTDIKHLKAQVLEIVNKDPKKYFKDQKSFKIGSIEITISSAHTYEIGGEFDLVAFFKKYPNAVDFKLKHAQMANIPLEKFDIGVKETEKMDVAYKATKEKV